MIKGPLSFDDCPKGSVDASIPAVHTVGVVTERELWEANVARVEAVMHERWGQTDKSLAATFEAHQRAIDQVAQTTNARFASMDEFRAVLSDQAGRLATRVEVEQHAGANAVRITDLASRLDKVEARTLGIDDARTTTRQNSTLAITGVGLVIAVIVAVVTIIATRQPAAVVNTPGVDALATATVTVTTHP
jgi:hypothetical protein